MERKIGETFTYLDGHKLKVKPATDLCKGCYFYNNGCDLRVRIITESCNNIIFKDITNMKEEINEIKITVPEGMEIDKENSTFECIKFKKKEGSWRSEFKRGLKGYGMHTDGEVGMVEDKARDLRHSWVFANEKQAKSAQAMAQISQIMANDKRFGGVVTDDEWCLDTVKYVIYRCENTIVPNCYCQMYHFLAFHIKEQLDLFLKENEDLVKDYLMID